MKKVLLVLAFAFVASFANNLQAQQIKIGVFDEETILQLMPGIQKIDSLLQIYLKDSLGVERDYDLTQYQRKDSAFKKDSATMPAKAREMMKKEINELGYKLVNWNQYQQQMLQNKQAELLAPTMQKVYDALRDIITNEKYTHVFKSDAFFAPPSLSDNLVVKVAQKLKWPLPKELEEALKAQGAPAQPAKPAAKPAGKG
jgi:Skp family chaperone for outer membrane proteins